MKSILETVTTAVMLVVACGVGYNAYASRPKAQAPPKVPSQPISLADLPALGDPTAPYAILEFSDFECPYCGVFATKTFPDLRRKAIDTGRARFYFANFPLPFHAHARPAAERAICSPDFWEAAERYFSDQAHLEALTLATPAATFPDEFGHQGVHECAGAIDASLALGKAVGVTGTPYFVIGQQQGLTLTPVAVMAGASSVDAFLKEFK